ncbi:CPBP family intramembrane metalloprotease [Flavobacteriaceae bacterium KMM 6897]|nr:CPBP family intramembrane metalloprotease [Flavobacteriaceae bacterium KMM 6897]
MENTNTKRHFGKDLVFPFLLCGIIIFVFLNVKHIPFDFSEKDNVVLRYFIKFVMTILVPFGLIQLLYKSKNDFGIYFPKFSDSFKLSLNAYAIGGPAGITFLLIGLLGWEFSDWPGSLILSVVYLLVFYYIPKVTKRLPTRNELTIPNKGINTIIIFSFCTVVFAFFTYEYIPIFSKILYYIFIVGLGEELLFRGYVQSSLNRYFGKSFRIGDVKYGWGLILSAVLFGLMHALVVVPPLWPWALFTFILGLTLGFIREKDGSILSAVMLHALFDMPLIFIN